MRGNAVALGRAGAAVAGPSSAAARPMSTSLQHVRPLQSRHLATHADWWTSTSSAPPGLFQDLVNEAMKPIFLHSAQLSPSPRKHETANGKVSKRLPQSHSKKSGSALDQANDQLTRATGSKVYANRAHMIVRFIRCNRVLSAMAAFEDDIANPNRTPFSVQQMEDFIVALRIQIKKHSTLRPAPKLSHSIARDLWRPCNLDPSISAKALPIPTQCMYAMGAMYDVCVKSNGSSTSKMVSSMLSTLIAYSLPGQWCQAADTALGHLVPATHPDQAACLRNISHRALSAFVTTYGAARQPEKGETLLDRWAKAHRANGVAADASVLHADEAIDLSGWGHNVVMWQSLIKSRIDAGDLYGARRWLERYRTAARSLQKHAAGAAAPYPPFKPEPYLAYMAGIRRKAERPRPGRGWIKRVTAEVRGAVGLMIEDHVPIESSVLAFVIDFEARVGNVEGGASLIQQLSSIIADRALQNVDLLRALLRFRKAAIDAQEIAAPPFALKDKYSALPTLRSLIRSIVLVGDAEARTTQENIASARSRGTLTTALITAMAERDYPAAVVVLNLFERWRILPSLHTYSHVVIPLISHGHTSALRAEPGEVDVSDSKLNLEETLQKIARDAKDVREQVAIQMAGNPSMGETSITSAQPSTPLRQTQYLIRVLNRACAAEIESAETERVVSDWLTERRKDEAGLSVQKRVKRAIFAAQTELLGTREERDGRVQRKKVWRRNDLLFSAAPSLSPHRWGCDAPAQREPKVLSRKVVASGAAEREPKVVPRNLVESGAAKRVKVQGRVQDYVGIPAAGHAAASVRAFSTSAVRRDTGASCDLASASKGDHTHLEPVRTIYIPGFVPYNLGLALQEHLVKQRSDARAALRALSDASSTSASTLSGLSTVSPSATESSLRAQAEQDTLLLLQHRPVYTEGRRHDSEDSLVSDHLRALGADYHLTKRGGQITYHGPGQLVGYPILNLASMGLASRCYVDRIQDSLISLLAERGVETVPPPDDHTGVWADEYHKIASIGIQVRHRITSHGFALNVEQRAMKGFRHIVACGIVGRSMTCLQDRLDPQGPFAKHYPPTSADPQERVESVAQGYKQHFAQTFKRAVRDVRADEMLFELVPEEQRQTLADKLGIDVDEAERVVGAITVDGTRVTV